MAQADSPMRVHLYKVESDAAAPELSTTLEAINQLPLEHRLKDVGYQKIRLELAKEPKAPGRFWCLDFCKLRNQGPGRAAPNKASTSFNLDADERFSEETAAVFDPVSGYLALQYNHYGPRSGSIADYLSLFLDPGLSYDLQLKLDPSVQARVKKKVQFTGFGYRVAPAKLSPQWKLKNVAMNTALQRQQVTYGGDWVTIDISLEPYSSGTLKLKDKLKGVLGLADEGDAVTRVEVRGRDGRDEKIEVVDLLSEKVEKTYKGLTLDPGLRIAADERWSKLTDALTYWKKNGLI